MIALARIRNDSWYAYYILKIKVCNSYFRDSSVILNACLRDILLHLSSLLLAIVPVAGRCPDI